MTMKEPEHLEKTNLKLWANFRPHTVASLSNHILYLFLTKIKTGLHEMFWMHKGFEHVWAI